MGLSLFDAHVHLGWCSDATRVAQAAAEKNLGLFAVTVTPAEYLALRDTLAGEKNVALAAGLHPWWVRDARDAGALCGLLADVRWVGEIGLDAAPRRAATWDTQLAAFERICAACAETSDPAEPKALSVHAVRAAGVVLDVLERTGAAARCRCVLHWFSGSSEELWRAAQLGCRFSLGERALATRRGREYARVLPADLLLTETDLPETEHSPTTADDIAASLTRTTKAIATARNTPAEAVRLQLAANATALLRGPDAPRRRPRGASFSPFEHPPRQW